LCGSGFWKDRRKKRERKRMPSNLKNDLLFLFLIYVVMDWITTYQIVADPGLVEINPTVKYIIKEFGWGGFMAAKLLVFGFICGVSILFTTLKVKHKRKVYSFNWAWKTLYTFIMIFNIIVILNNIILIIE
jgi:hypothetical protein